jgi:hypothetical protein
MRERQLEGRPSVARGVENLGGDVKWSSWLTWLGAVIALAGVVIGVWLQFEVPDIGGSFNAEQRLDYVAIGVATIASGALLAVAAQIMGMMQAARDQSRVPVPPQREASVALDREP